MPTRCSTPSSPIQAEHGLEPLTDAGWAIPGPDAVTAWRSTAGRAGRLVKAVIDGPFTSGRPVSEVRALIADLADAGCAWIEVREPAATTIGTDPARRARFADAHAALTDGVDGVHLSLAITGGDASAAGIETILAGTYASLALDLIDGPDGWYLVSKTPTTVGIICGALSTRSGSDDTIEVLAWAAAYAASTAARGTDRVGLATAGSLAALSWDEAALKVQRLGEAAALAGLPLEEQRRRMNPRAVDLRSAALGRYDPPEERPGRRSEDPPEAG